MEAISEIVKFYERPTGEQIFCVKPDTSYLYVSSTYCDGLVNYLDNVRAYALRRYTDEEEFHDAIESTKHLPEWGNGSWYHTAFSRFIPDNILVTGEIRHYEGEGDYFAIYYDQDVSDCCLFRVARHHYKDLDEFNKAIVEEMLIWPEVQEIIELRKPEGWIKF